jgi:lambda repressor-like predicted transcriptional regulator
MTPNEIRAELMLKGSSPTKIAEKAQRSKPEVSMCINGDRIYPEIREVIARELGRPIEKVFGKFHPQPKSGRAGAKAA